MSAQVDYRDGRDAVSGEPVSLVPAPYQPEHFTDRRSDEYFQRQIEAALSLEDRHDRLRTAKLNAAIATLAKLIRDAQDGDGIACSRVVEAASSDLIIALLTELLQQAKAFIPESDPARLRIDAALIAAGQ
jgi:hypothetical protein